MRVAGEQGLNRHRRDKVEVVRKGFHLAVTAIPDTPHHAGAWSPSLKRGILKKSPLKRGGDRSPEQWGVSLSRLKTQLVARYTVSSTFKLIFNNSQAHESTVIVGYRNCVAKE